MLRFCSAFLAATLISLMLSGCLFIPIPIGVIYPSTAYQKPDGAVTSGAENVPSTSLPDDKLAAEKHHQQSAWKRHTRVECNQQAEKLLSDADRRAYIDADRRAYIKECMSEER